MIIPLITLLALLSPLRSRPAIHAKHPLVFTGTFIQWYLTKDWNEAKWQSEVAYLKAAGLKYIVLSPAVDSKSREAFYPTRVPGIKQAAGYRDIIDLCLRTASNAGLKVFLGMNANEDWWRKEATDPAWLLAQMDLGNTIADDLYSRYHAKYPRTFIGWYWDWEVDNLNFNTPARRQTLASALDRNVSHLHHISPGMPVMLCPFMNSALGKPETYAEMWRDVFAHCALTKGDIFCPQDCVGAGGLKLAQVADWFRALKTAVDTKPGLRFWSDTETFIENDWTAAPLNRELEQLQAVAPYVEQSITFAYSHYYSPNVKPDGFQRTYLDYLKTGQLESVPPSQPQELTGARATGNSIKLEWRRSTDNIGVCGYYIRRNGKLISRLQRNLGEAETERVSFTDKKVPEDPCIYTVEAYDFAGNESPAAQVTVP
jgi:hypothetical protein